MLFQEQLGGHPDVLQAILVQGDQRANEFFFHLPAELAIFRLRLQVQQDFVDGLQRRDELFQLLAVQCYFD